MVKTLVLIIIRPVSTLEGTMQPEKFESLISPPWPAAPVESIYYYPPHLQRQQAELVNFERNDEANNNLDRIAVLGYD